MVQMNADPSYIDNQLMLIDDGLAANMIMLVSHAKAALRLLGHSRDEENPWPLSAGMMSRLWDSRGTSTMKLRVLGTLLALEADKADLEEERQSLVEEFNRRGGWTRFYAIEKGLIHSEPECRQGASGAETTLIPFLSGLHPAIVASHYRQRMCPICFDDLRQAAESSRTTCLDTSGVSNRFS